MRILIDVAHPAHVHFFRNFIRGMTSRGHTIQITARDKEVTLALLDAYGFDYRKRGVIKKNLLRKGIDLLAINLGMLKIAREFGPDLLIGVHNPYIAQISWVIRRPSIIFTDTENVGMASLLTFPFTRVICTPSCFRERINPAKHVKYNGFKELAYLHPRYFTPTDEVIRKLGLSRGDPFILLRFISWGASHDTNLQGIRPGSELDFIRRLEKFGSVFLTSERPLPTHLQKYRIHLPPEKIHSVLYHALLYIGEGGTMATEAAVLGTPAIHIESTTSGRPTGEMSGNFLELRDNYQLLQFFADQDQALDKASEILESGNFKAVWKERREKLLVDKIDVTEWMVHFIEEFPESFHTYIQRKG